MGESGKKNMLNKGDGRAWGRPRGCTEDGARCRRRRRTVEGAEGRPVWGRQAEVTRLASWMGLLQGTPRKSAGACGAAMLVLFAVYVQSRGRIGPKMQFSSPDSTALISLFFLAEAPTSRAFGDEGGENQRKRRKTSK